VAVSGKKSKSGDKDAVQQSVFSPENREQDGQEPDSISGTRYSYGVTLLRR
jgi:hypothetical protein